ncbi:MAG: hypothetical protein K8U57_09215 [Planctomycetes bacterium]|nr:hypothetical protein [Planctomycetota bacterium]
MLLTNEITPVEGNSQLPLLQAAQGLAGSKDGKGVGDLADLATIDGWVHDYLAGEGDPADAKGMAAAFRFGVNADGRYAGQTFIETEPELRSEWSSEKGHLPWDTVRDAVWAGFDRARDRRG